MAYLRGESYVDGNLVVAGALQVKQITSLGDNIPYLVNGRSSSKKNYLTLFGDTTGGLNSSSVVLTETSLPGAEITPPAAGSEMIYLTFSNEIKNIYAVDNSDLKLNSKTLEWEYA